MRTLKVSILKTSLRSSRFTAFALLLIVYAGVVVFGQELSSGVKIILKAGGFVTLYIICITCIGIGGVVAEFLLRRKNRFTEETLYYLRSEATTLGLLGSLIAITYEGGDTIVRIVSDGKATPEAFSFLFHSWNSTVAGIVASHLSYLFIRLRGEADGNKE